MLSIVTSVYKTAQFLAEFEARASAAAIGCGFADYEMIFVIDGSPDHALDELRRIQSRNPRVRVVELSRNFGHHPALWCGLQRAKGELVFLADSDLETASDAAAIAEALDRYGHVPLYGVHFLTGSAGLAPESVIVLGEVAAMLEDDPDLRLRIEGHTDNLGDKQANLALSAKRANAIAAWLTMKGVKRTRLEVKGMGDTQPVAGNDTDAGRSKNRRIELVKLAEP